VHIPYLVANAVLARVAAGSDDFSTVSLVVMIVTLLTLALGYVVLEGAIVLAVARRYVGEAAEAGAIIRETLSRLGGLTLVVLGKWLVISLASILLLIPWIYVFAGYFAIPVVMLVEKLPARDSVKRSWALSRKGKLRILATLFVCYMLYFMLSSIPGVFPGIGLAISGAMSVLLFPLIGCGYVLLYYDARIRHEGFDIEYMARGLEPEPLPAPANLA
jgi:hypothetical protein